MTTSSAETPIIAWENEHASIFVWGTHDPAAALPAVETAYVVDSGFPLGSRDFIESMPTLEEMMTARRYWAHPEVLDQEEWDDSQYGPTQMIGWVPYLFLAR